MKMASINSILTTERPRKTGFEKVANESYYGAKNKMTADDVNEWENCAAGIPTDDHE